MIACSISLRAPEHALLALSIYSAATWSCVALLNLYDTARMERYLKREHPEKWRELTLVNTRHARPGYIAVQRFVRSRQDLGDPRLTAMARSARITGRLPIVLFVHYPVLLGWGVYLKAHA